MRRSRTSTGPLAEPDAALGRILESDCRKLGRVLAPHAVAVDAALDARLKRGGYATAERRSMLGITPLSAILRIGGGGTMESFAEEVRYRGRRLAKLGLTPAAVIQGLREADQAVAPVLAGAPRPAAQQYQRVRDGLNFLIVLALNASYHAVREAESRAFYELFRVETDSRDLADMLEGFREVLHRYTGAAEARIYWIGDAAPDSSQPAGADPLHHVARVRHARQLERMQCYVPSRRRLVDPAWERRFAQCWAVPLRDSQGLRGVMIFAFPKLYPWLPRERELLSAAAERCGLAAEKARLSAQLSRNERKLRHLANHMVVVEESERRRISRELHDEAGQSLLCVRLKLDMIEAGLPAGSAPLQAQVRQAREICEHTIIEIRRLIAALSPAVLEQMGLAAAIRQLVGRFRTMHPAAVSVFIPRRLNVSSKAAIILYRLVQEMFNNIAKYSMATEVKIFVRMDDQSLRLRVEDNGVGFDVDEAMMRPDCHGLSGMKERVALLGGVLNVKSRPAPARNAAGDAAVATPRSGTVIDVSLPAAVDTEHIAVPGMIGGAEMAMGNGVDLCIAREF